MRLEIGGVRWADLAVCTPSARQIVDTRDKQPSTHSIYEQDTKRYKEQKADYCGFLRSKVEERAAKNHVVASLERSSARLRGTMMMERARADRFRQRMRFMESELRQIRRFRYYDRTRFRRLETFVVRRLGFRP
ncbi:hypothetical protein Tco_0471699 [Tanacetum coccineum]